MEALRWKRRWRLAACLVLAAWAATARPAPALCPDSGQAAQCPIPAAAPSSSSAAGAHDERTLQVVTLHSGEVLRGVLIEESADEIVLAHDLLGRLVIPRRAIASIEVRMVQAQPTDAAPAPAPGSTLATAPPSATATAAAPAPAPAASTRVRSDAPRPEWAASGVDIQSVPDELPPPGTVEWLANIQASLSGVDSDNDQLDLRAAAEAQRRTCDDLLSLDAEYYFSLLNGDTTDNNLLATAVYDRFFEPSDWLAFGKGQYQYDQFQSWEHRLSAYGGLGYRVFRLPPLALTLKLGAGATHEFGEPSQTTPEGYGEAAFLWRIDERQRLEGGVNIAPDLTDLSSYRVLARLDWTFRVDPKGLALVGGVREEYQSKVSEGSTNNDLRYYAGFRLDF